MHKRVMVVFVLLSILCLSTVSAGVGGWFRETFGGPESVRLSPAMVAPSYSESFEGSVSAQGMNVVAEGKVGKGLSGAGTSQSQYYLLPSTSFPAITSTQVFSFAIWFKTSASGVGILEQTGSSSAVPPTSVYSHVPALYVGTDGTLRSAFFWDNYKQVVSSQTVNDGQWHHAVVTFDGTTERLYIDGASVGSVPKYQSWPSGNTYILGTASNSGWDATAHKTTPYSSTLGSWMPFNGVLDEVQVYSTALSASQVSDLYNSYVGGGGGGTVTCTDSDVTSAYPDGINVFIKGTAIDPVYGAASDSCATVYGPTYIYELHCRADGFVETSPLLCPEGRTCIEGACLPTSSGSRTVQLGEWANYSEFIQLNATHSVEVTTILNSSSSYDNDQIELQLRVNGVRQDLRYTATISSEGRGRVVIGSRFYDVEYRGAATIAPTERQARLTLASSPPPIFTRDIITFENGRVGVNALYVNYTEKGFYFSNTMDQSWGINGLSPPLDRDPLNGGLYAQILRGILVVSRPDGKLFNLNSLDLAEYNTLASLPYPLIFLRGYRSDNSFVEINLSLDGRIDGSGSLSDFQTFDISSTSLKNLTKLEISTGIYYYSPLTFAYGSFAFSLDNLVLTSPTFVDQQLCTDSDVTSEYPDGKNYNLRGSVTASSQSPPVSYDFCFDSMSLGEYYCASGSPTVASTMCPYGCSQGACLPEPPQVCSELIDYIASPSQNFTEGAGFYQLTQNGTERGTYIVEGVVQDYTRYDAGWNGGDGDQHLYVYSSLMVFDDSQVDASSLIPANGLCAVRDIGGNIVYLCNQGLGDEWDLVDSSSHRSQYVYAYWAQDNVFVTIVLGTSRYLDADQIDRRIQEQLVKFTSDLRDNKYRYTDDGASVLDYGSQRGILPQWLDLCASDVVASVTQSSLYCKKEPALCPPHGTQQLICYRWGEKGQEVVERSGLTCSPGICSGCMVPKWFGDKLDNKCLPYGHRFAAQSGTTFELVSGKDGESLTAERGGDEYDLSVIDGQRAVLVLHGKTQDFTYKLVEGNSYDFSDFFTDIGDDDDYVTLSFFVSDVSLEDQRVDFTVSYERYEERIATYNAYCDVDGQVKSQQGRLSDGNWAQCQNNYECESNVCSSGECVEVQSLLSQGSGFKTLAVKALCRISNLFNDDGYNTCLSEYLGLQPPIVID